MTTKEREMEMAEGLKVDTQQSPSNGRGTCASRPTGQRACGPESGNRALNAGHRAHRAKRS